MLQIDDAHNILHLLDRCEKDIEFRRRVEKELEEEGLERRLTPNIRSLIRRGVWASMGLSLNKILPNIYTDNTSFENILVNEKDNTETIVMENIQLEDIYRAVDKLYGDEKAVIILSFGLGGAELHTIDKISKYLSIDKVSVVDIRERALWKLKSIIENKPIVSDTRGTISLLLAVFWAYDNN